METMRHCLGVHQNNLSVRLDLLTASQHPNPVPAKVESKLQGVVEAVKRAADQEEREDEEREAAPGR